MERLQKRGIQDKPLVSQIDKTIRVDSTTLKTPVAPPAVDTQKETPFKRPKVDLTPEQRERIEKNRQKALEIRKRLDQNNRDASTYVAPQLPVPKGLEQQQKENEKSKANKQDEIKPVTKKRDYIDYDFSTMKDTYGGFMEDKEDAEDADINKSLEEWKEKQKREHIVRDLPPPMDPSQAPKCYECESLEIDPNLYSNFRQVRVCRRCAKEKPEKYALLTKTESKEDYLLTEPELQDVALLPRIEKPNPHGYSRMQLFLRFQVEEFAVKKWGSLEQLDKEWEKREEMRLKRKDKKYNDKLREMRRKTRAEEYTRKLRNGKSINDRHIHDWAKPIPFVKDDMNFIKKRCVDCGIETDELQL